MTEKEHETVYDREGNVVENPDLELGEIVVDVVIRPDAEPIDNETKHAWADGDYMERPTYVPYPPEALAGIRAGREREAWMADGPRAQDEQMDALAELGAMVADGAATLEDVLNAVAEIGVLVASMGEGV